MRATVVRGLAAAAFVLGTCAARAEGEALGCTLPMPDGPLLADRAGTLARYEQLPQACLRELFNACSHASSRTLLDFDTAARCSLGYEALLRQGFGGNFGALLAWWRSQRTELR